MALHIATCCVYLLAWSMGDRVLLPDEIHDSSPTPTKKRPASADAGTEIVLLPEEIESDDGSDNNDDCAGSPVRLPDMVLSMCCHKRCIEKRQIVDAKQAWDAIERTSEDQAGEQFRQVKEATHCAESAVKAGLGTVRPYKYFGVPICRAGFLHQWNMGNSKLDRFVMHAQQGFTEPPQDLRRGRPARENKSASIIADRFWLWMYNNVAESLAEGVLKVGDEMDPVFGNGGPPAGPDKTKNTLVLVADNGTTGLSASDEALQPENHPRYLPPVLWEDIQTLFDEWCREQSHVCSFQTVKNVWNVNWFKSLLFRKESQHKVCDQCMEFKLLRRKAGGNSVEVEKVKAAYIRHIQDQMRDRTIDARISSIAGENIQRPSAPSKASSDILNFTIDAMEQAKFRVPRHEGLNSKTGAAFWRPQLHVTGSVVDGVKEFLFLSDCTLPKNANTQITMLATILQGSFDVLQSRRRNFPKVLRCVSDNASGETKNQTVCKFLAWLVFKGKVQSAELSQFRVGHTHNRQDQRFSVIGTVITKPATHMYDTLETITDFAEVIEKKVAGE